jgi:probable rRNA maturation factor
MSIARHSGGDASSPEKSSATRASQLLIAIANRQRTKKINSRRLKEIAEALLAELQITEAELGINLVGAREMALVNETFLQHEGPTDVITFDHRNCEVRSAKCEVEIHGELFICVDVANRQAKEFKSSWQAEAVRYVVHGVLHLIGHDDLKPHLRRKMKREENRLVRLLSKRFSLAQLSGADKLGA